MRQNSRPLLVGITGNIGSGKSFFCKQIEKQYQVVYTDILAKKALNQNEIIQKLVSHWGSQILSNGKLDFSKIAKLVFNNLSDLSFLNKIVHPEVLKKMQDIVINSDEQILFFEVPLLYEAKLEKCFDHIVLIMTDEQIRIKRLLDKGALTYSEIVSRIKTQQDDNIKKNRADTIITNNDSEDALIQSANHFLTMISNAKKRTIRSFI